MRLITTNTVLKRFLKQTQKGVPQSSKNQPTICIKDENSARFVSHVTKQHVNKEKAIKAKS